MPISAFTGLTTKANITQLVFASVPSGSSVVYIDNVLFSKKTQTNITSVNAEIVGMYPNPATSTLHIRTTNSMQDVVLYNAMGQVVLKTSPASNETDVNIADLPVGVYFVKVRVNGVDTFNKISKQ